MLPQQLHLVVEHIAQQTHASLREIVVHGAVDVRHVDAAVDQHGYRAEQVGIEDAVSEVARVGHDAHVERFGHRPGDRLLAGQRHDEPVDDV